MDRIVHEVTKSRSLTVQILTLPQISYVTLGSSPEGGQGNPLQYSCLENPHGQRSLAGYSQWGHKESDMTEQLSTAQEYSLVGGGTYLEPGLLALSPSSLHAACLKLGTLAFIQCRAQGGGGSS